MRKTKEVKISFNVIHKIWKALISNKKVVIAYGGAGSGKSYTVAQYLIVTALQYPDLRAFITRKTNPSLRLSTWKLMTELLSEYEIPHTVFAGEQTIAFPNGSVFVFRGMDDPEKLKSTEFNIAWMEEATEFDLQDYLQVKLRLRRKAVKGFTNKVILSFNPVPSWVKGYFFEEKRENDIEIVRVTYKDNPFLHSEYIEVLEALREQSKIHYQIYVLGEFAVPEHIVFSNWETVDELPSSFDDVVYGIDFGYNNPTAVLKIGLMDDNVYVLDEVYKQYLTNADLIGVLESFVDNKRRFIYADSSEPQRIEEIRRAGFNIFPAKKDVKLGIDFLKRKKIYIARHCVNTLKEIKLYSWKQNNNGDVLDEPVKINDHTMDALRYAVYSYYNYHGGKVLLGKQRLNVEI